MGKTFSLSGEKLNINILLKNFTDNEEDLDLWERLDEGTITKEEVFEKTKEIKQQLQYI